jgi:hypothetical protein
MSGALGGQMKKPCPGSTTPPGAPSPPRGMLGVPALVGLAESPEAVVPPSAATSTRPPHPRRSAPKRCNRTIRQWPAGGSSVLLSAAVARAASVLIINVEFLAKNADPTQQEAVDDSRRSIEAIVAIVRAIRQAIGQEPANP